MKQQQKNMRSGSRPSPKGTRLLFAGGTVSPMMRPADGQQKDDKIVQTEDKPRLGQRQSRKKQRVDRNEVVDLRWISICLVFRGDSVWYRTSLYHIPYHAISQDTIYRDIVVNGYLAVELQKKSYLLGNTYQYAHMGVHSRPTWMLCFERIKITHYATSPPTRTTSFRNWQTAASSNTDEYFCSGPEHLSSSSRKSWRRQHGRKREMEKEKSDAALATIFD